MDSQLALTSTHPSPQRQLLSRLGAWSVFSLISGMAMQFGPMMMRGVGVQFALWGMIDGVIAWAGLRLGRKPLPIRTLRLVLLINAVLDIFYVLGGLRLLRSRGATDANWRGQGFGIIIQGGFLFFFDLFHALFFSRASDEPSAHP